MWYCTKCCLLMLSSRSAGNHVRKHNERLPASRKKPKIEQKIISTPHESKSFQQKSFEAKRRMRYYTKKLLEDDALLTERRSPVDIVLDELIETEKRSIDDSVKHYAHANKMKTINIPQKVIDKYLRIHGYGADVDERNREEALRKQTYNSYNMLRALAKTPKEERYWNNFITNLDQNR